MKKEYGLGSTITLTGTIIGTSLVDVTHSMNHKEVFLQVEFDCAYSPYPRNYVVWVAKKNLI